MGPRRCRLPKGLGPLPVEHIPPTPGSHAPAAPALLFPTGNLDLLDFQIQVVPASGLPPQTQFRGVHSLFVAFEDQKQPPSAPPAEESLRRERRPCPYTLHPPVGTIEMPAAGQSGYITARLRCYGSREDAGILVPSPPTGTLLECSLAARAGISC